MQDTPRDWSQPSHDEELELHKRQWHERVALVATRAQCGKSEFLGELERGFHDLIKSVADERLVVPDDRLFASAGFPPLHPYASMGRAVQPITCVVPPYEERLARHAGLVKLPSERLWQAKPGAMLDRLVRWFTPRKFLALRAARSCTSPDALPPPSYSDEQFQERAEQGEKYARLIARLFNERNVAIESTPYVFRGDVSEIVGFSRRETDLILPKSRVGIEVKSRNRKWTTPSDFPFETMLVDTLNGYLLKLDVPLAYVVVSTKNQAISVIPTHTVTSWGCRRRRDNDREKDDGSAYEDDFLQVSKHKLESFDWLLQLCASLETSEQPQRVLVDAGYDLALTKAILEGSQHKSLIAGFAGNG